MSLHNLDFQRKIISDVNMNFTSGTFKQFWRQVNMEQTMMMSYYHQSNGQVKAWIKSVKTTIKCLNNNNGVNTALLQIISTLIGPGLPSPTIINQLEVFYPKIVGNPYILILMILTMKTSKHIKINAIRVMILMKTHFFHRVYSSHTVWRWCPMDVQDHQTG